MIEETAQINQTDVPLMITEQVTICNCFYMYVDTPVIITIQYSFIPLVR